jgi:hypothetical protein
VFSGLLSVTMAVFIWAGMANAAPEQVLRSELVLGAVLVVYVISAVATAMLLRKQRVRPALLMAVLPAALLFTLLLVLLVQ